MSGESSVFVSAEWEGEDVMSIPQEQEKRVDSVWIEDSRSQALSSCTDQDYSALLSGLVENEDLSVVHPQKNYVADWNEIVDPSNQGIKAWGRIRRFEDFMIPKGDPAQSIVYEDSFASRVVANDGSSTALLSTFAVQQSVEAASQDAWLTFTGVVKYDNISFVIDQSYDGEGCIVAFKGNGQLKPRFMLEVGKSFSDALFRKSHAMWIKARYCKFCFRWATWHVPIQKHLGPSASSTNACMLQAFSTMGYQSLGVTLVRQLERIKAGFAAASEEKLREDAKMAAAAAG